MPRPWERTTAWSITQFDPQKNGRCTMCGERILWQDTGQVCPTASYRYKIDRGSKAQQILGKLICTSRQILTSYTLCGSCAERIDNLVRDAMQIKGADGSAEETQERP